MRAAQASCDAVAVSIFVNPTQFGPKEDFASYPRTLEEDCRTLEAAGVDMVFAPSVQEMYPSGASTFVEVAGLSDRLDGASRPGHFRGVATVVAKLLNIFAPERAFFGQKDAAQVAVLRKMVRDLRFAVQLEVCPIVREADGLAMSSRNRNLSDEQRRQALVLSRALMAVQQKAQSGEHESAKLLAEALRVLRGNLLRSWTTAASSTLTLSRTYPMSVEGRWWRWRPGWVRPGSSITCCFSWKGRIEKHFQEGSAELVSPCSWTNGSFSSYACPNQAPRLETKGLPARRKRAGRSASLLMPILGVTRTSLATKPSSRICRSDFGEVRSAPLSRSRVIPKAWHSRPGPEVRAATRVASSPRFLAMVSRPRMGSSARNRTPPARPSRSQETFRQKYMP